MLLYVSEEAACGSVSFPVKTGEGWDGGQTTPHVKGATLGLTTPIPTEIRHGSVNSLISFQTCRRLHV